MKKNKGFTLIELLAVIVILGILLSISVIAVGKIKNKQENKNLENVISSILTGAKEYYTDNILEENKKVTVKTLLEGNYTDFDENKYSYLLNNSIIVKKCEDKSLKFMYSIEINDITYNDCGCEKQEEGDSKPLCTD